MYFPALSPTQRWEPDPGISAVICIAFENSDHNSSETKQKGLNQSLENKTKPHQFSDHQNYKANMRLVNLKLPKKSSCNNTTNSGHSLYQHTLLDYTLPEWSQNSASFMHPQHTHKQPSLPSATTPLVSQAPQWTQNTPSNKVLLSKKPRIPKKSHLSK